MESASFARPRRTYVYREKSPATGELYAALAKATAEYLPVERDTEADWGWFASLNSMLRATRPALSKQMIGVTQEYALIDAQLCVVTVVSHGPSDQWVSSVLPVRQTGDVHDDAAYMTTMRRLAYAALLCLAPEDERGVEARVENADAKAKSESWEEQKRLARDALTGAPNADAVAKVMARVRQKIDAGDMNPDHFAALEQHSLERVRQLASQAQKKKPMEVTA